MGPQNRRLSERTTACSSLAATDWAVAYLAITTAGNAAGARPDGSPFLSDSSTRPPCANQYGNIIDEGIQMLGSAIKIDPNYSDAMAYMNLLYRLNAFLAENVADSTANLKEAEEWVKRPLAAEPKGHRQFSPLAPPLPPPPPPPPRPTSNEAAAFGAVYRSYSQPVPNG